jgi:DNA-binding NarL/FixJ family response regulator
VRMSEVSPGSKILFLSQDNDADTVQVALGTAAWGYVHKLSAGTELLTAIAAVLQGRRFVSSGITPYRVEWGCSGSAPESFIKTTPSSLTSTMSGSKLIVKAADPNAAVNSVSQMRA